MAPALLGVSVAQISVMINTQIASHQGVGAVSWLGYADQAHFGRDFIRIRLQYVKAKPFQ